MEIKKTFLGVSRDKIIDSFESMPLSTIPLWLSRMSLFVVLSIFLLDIQIAKKLFIQAVYFSNFAIPKILLSFCIVFYWDTWKKYVSIIKKTLSEIIDEMLTSF